MGTGQLIRLDADAGRPARSSGSVTTGLEVIQPILDIPRAPPDLPCADIAGAWKGAIARAAIERRARLESGDIKYISDSQKLISIRRHGAVLSMAHGSPYLGQRKKAVTQPKSSISVTVAKETKFAYLGKPLPIWLFFARYVYSAFADLHLGSPTAEAAFTK